MPDDPRTAFASVDDLKKRLKRDALDGADADLATVLLEAATASISVEIDKDETWVERIETVPRMLKFVCVEVAARIFNNPEAAASAQERLGAHSRAVTYREAAKGGGLTLTDQEKLLVRSAVYGETSASVKTKSHATEIFDNQRPRL